MRAAFFKGTITRLSTHGNNEFVHSAFTKYDAECIASSVFGIKYVVSGTERYMFNNKIHEVHDGQYLLVNKDRVFECNFKSDEPVHGYCIGLDEEMMAGIYHDLNHSEEFLLDNPFNTTDGFEGLHELVYSSGNELGRFIRELIERNEEEASVEDNASSQDLFYEIGVRLLHAHKCTSEKIAKLKARRASTKKELFSRLEQARQLLDTNLDQQLPVATLARHAALSEFHFYRSFKAVYGVSPHQYLLQQKLTHSAELVKDGKLSVSEIAYRAGFSDIYSFSKAFKQRFGVAPSKWRGE